MVLFNNSCIYILLSFAFLGLELLLLTASDSVRLHLLTRVTELVCYTMTVMLVHFGCNCLTNNITF